MATVTNTDWGVSYSTGSHIDGCILAVHMVEDRPNEWGGRGVVVHHPDYHGLTFPTLEDAKAFCLDVGLILVWVRTR